MMSNNGNDTEQLLQKLREVLETFENEINDNDVRARVIALLPAFDTLRELGKSLITKGLSISARDRLLKYFQTYPGTVLREKELALVAGISEWARRVRELRYSHMRGGLWRNG